MTATAIRPAASPSDGALSHRQILTILSGLVMGMFLLAALVLLAFDLVREPAEAADAPGAAAVPA